MTEKFILTAEFIIENENSDNGKLKTKSLYPTFDNGI